MMRLWIKMMTRKCRGCIWTEPHSHHLTALGRWWYIKRHMVPAGKPPSWKQDPW